MKCVSYMLSCQDENPWSLRSHCMICDYTDTGASLGAVCNTPETSNILGKCSVRKGDESFKL